MTREQYRQMWEAELEKQKANTDKKRKDATLSADERDLCEQEYQSLCQQQDAWASGGFWTENEEAAYKLHYERDHEANAR